ncbi:MAG: HupE/UreJ family protein, partial [Chthoniobacterales bacterium]
MISGKWLFCAVLWSVVISARAHDLPLSYVDLRLNDQGIDVTVESSAKNFSRALGDVDEPTLLASPPADRLLAVVTAGLTISSSGAKLTPEFRAVEPLPGRRDVRVQLHYPSPPGDTLELRGALFPADPRHKTFLNIYEDEALRYQGIFDQSTTQIEFRRGAEQSIGVVARQFVYEGIHHIFIGPDHILFIVGLLLLGGSLRHLFKIVTAFTIAHSVTLVLATLNLLNPPARLIEPIIALSIVFVGAHALLRGSGRRDWRVLFAFGFGFIHGFGFANVLRAMHLPR